MSVIAKFYVTKVDRHEGAPTASGVHLGAVCRGKENAGWASATPSGSINLGILNDKATDYFEEGAEYLVTFEKVAKPTPGDGHAPVLAETQGSVMCQFCGMYAVGGPDGLDWSAHERVYGA